MLDTGFAAILISFIPFMMVLSFFVFRRTSRKQLSLVLGFMFLTEFYIFAVDPALINSLYLQKGDYAFPIELSIIGGVLLLIAVVAFKKGLGEGGPD